ncbi:hydrogenase maturation carbamoyltransferase HypF [Enterobacillus tribolii]|uniref:Carbamoyltransferase HypF n=1 Tax=Enterobacillus tribolii TaxID=1487935 RepID=A0A370Q8C4_9GAMM|nr:carbamoyltransferase HypF [Enterobacillus tribolii]RDK84624.1 hydrogenase maturation carbamoyltransferase HypF [Enterobacillus tribolii]
MLQGICRYLTDILPHVKVTARKISDNNYHNGRRLVPSVVLVQELSLGHQAIALRIKGKVQGVGFRPFVWQLARRLGLQGEVSNDAQGVLVALRLPADVSAFCALLRHECPPLARIDSIDEQLWHGGELPDDFLIVHSGQGKMDTQIVPDAATCPACLQEMATRSDRRYAYPFINCTHCGPRFTIIRAMPYDRPFTSMSVFPLCERCAREYRDPADRRFHAQPVACPDCGPQIMSCRRDGEDAAYGEAAWAQIVETLLGGGIVAVKGIGGFHLVCDAQNPDTVSRLRERKHRPAKPLAVLLPDERWLAVYARAPVTPDIVALLKSPAAPVVLIAASEQVPAGLAPGLDEVGVMLPSNPLHHLLVQKMQRPLVMTSGNTSGLPPALSDEQALADLREIADLWLLHNREILQRADDSVVRCLPDGAEVLRRARGYVPDAIDLPPGFNNLPAIAAAGGDLKNTFCLLRGNRAVLSQHLGDVADERVLRQYDATWALFRQIYDFTPEQWVCDAHPGYVTHRLTQERARREGVPCHTVLHHHAHLAACMAEYGIPLDAPPVLGMALDGIGYGENGELWGGECLRADYRSVRRLGGLPAVALPGADAAARQPWRNLLAQMLRFVPDWQQRPEAFSILQNTWQPLAKAVERGINSPQISSAGRLFDAVAAALGISAQRQSWEGEAACGLEALAWQSGDEEFPVTMSVNGEGALEMAMFWRQWLDFRAAPARRARAFHHALAAGIAALIRFHAAAHERTVVLSGGVWHNRLLRCRLQRELADFTLLFPCALPAGDGGLALGQAVIAAARWIECEKDRKDGASPIQDSADNGTS